ncbi:XRE family transcriptional regulator [Butyricimonas paravirosa]|uniref:XRE family transcriptional regulator n=1 Tax=Butyricimonas paravirosa TaxID=1472417 RepID=UPI0022E1C359|nr:XRE family transcriptional regulator [Butyricimonas paravirosa]
MNDIPNRLRQLRAALSLTQKELANILMIKQGSYSTIETGKGELTDRNFKLICDTYSVNPKWLEFGEQPMFTEQKTTTEQLTSISFSKYNKSEVTQRFLIALEQLKIQGTPYSDVANKIGASTSLVSEIRRGKTFLLPHFAQKFIELFNVNKEWLLEGKGDNIFVLSENLSNVHPVKIENTEWIEVPFVPLHARATFAETFLDTNVREIETVRVQKRPGINYEKAKAFEVDGDSMEPTLVSGEQILCEIIDPNNWKFTTGVVVVAFGNMVVIKRIKDNELTNGKLVLWSDNELGGKITLSSETEEIRRMYKVKYSIYKPIR